MRMAQYHMNCGKKVMFCSGILCICSKTKFTRLFVPYLLYAFGYLLHTKQFKVKNKHFKNVY